MPGTGHIIIFCHARLRRHLNHHHGKRRSYLFEWRPVDCGDGTSFAILVGGNTISESNVILNRGYDYAYTFEPQTYSRPWGTIPDLVNINGLWGIPENWAAMPEAASPLSRSY